MANKKHEFAEYISCYMVQKAFYHFLDRIENSNLRCEFVHKYPKNKRTCNLYNKESKLPYAFIVCRKHLNFYFRKYTLSSLSDADLKKLEKDLTEDFGNNFLSKPNASIEFRVNLRSVTEVDRLARYLNW